MREYSHIIIGVYQQREQAEHVAAELGRQGLAADQLEIYGTGHETEDLIQPNATASNKVLKDVVTDGVVGTVLGAAAFGLGHLALVGANISLFVASPILGPLSMLGWGDSIGGLLGAIAGAAVNPEEHRDKKLADVVGEAIDKGFSVLVARTTDEQQTDIAGRIISNSVTAGDGMTTL